MDERVGDGDTSSSDESIDVEKMISAGFGGSNMATTGLDSRLVEECVASDSPDDIKSHFIEMGFSRALVDRVIRDTGGNDEELLLNTLCTYSALAESASDTVVSENGRSTPLRDENDSFGSDFKDSDDPQSSEDDGSKCENLAVKRASLQKMNFSHDEIDIAFDRMGAVASVEALVDFIIAKQAAGSSDTTGVRETFGGESVQKEIDSDGLFDTMEKTFSLLEMGFTQEEVSNAVTNRGHLPVSVLARSIYAARFSYKRDDGNPEDYRHCSFEDKSQKEDPSWNYDVDEDSPNYRSNRDSINEASTSSSRPRNAKPKKAKRQKLSTCDEQIDEFKVCNSDVFGPPMSPQVQGTVAFDALKESPTVSGDSGLPYFFYGNVLEVPESSWKKVSRFLHGAEPEFVDSKYFSATERKEAYVHNLPTENRSGLIPPLPTTIQEALPHVEKWWPSWDKRRKIGSINIDARGGEVCRNLSRIMVQSQGMPSCEDRNMILNQCKAHNLIWTEQSIPSIIALEDMEHLFGYPRLHTSGIDHSERLMLLKYNFQVDTLCYHLSGLRELFPRVNVLSMYTGIGGAVVALHKLGVHLDYVVSVEPSKLNRMILRRWWNSSSQTGELIEIDSIEKMNTARIDRMVQELGGFHLVIGRNSGKFVEGQLDMNRDSPEDVNFPLFFEFSRVLSCVSETMRSNAKDVS